MLGRLRHLVEQAVRLAVAQVVLQQRQVDLFFLGEMNSEQCMETVQHPAQILHLLYVEDVCFRAQPPQLFRQPAHFDMIAAHRCGRLRGAENLSNRWVEPVFLAAA
jgi:hypothetical protein